MRKTFSRIALAAATVLLLGSCSKINERIDGLESRIDGIENETIKTIDGQISSINTSIADLGTIRSNIQDLKSKTESQAGQIGELQDADKAIGERIDNLQKYVNDTLKSYATTEWVNATFSTLAQYEATCDTIAKIDARIGDLDTRLSKSIEDCADSLKTWVNVQLSAYYTAAQMDATVAELQAAIDTASAVAAATADSISAELSATKAAIDTAKANIRTEYRAAISTAITALDGKLSKALADSIAAVNDQIKDISDDVSLLRSDLDALAGRVTKLENMIQSVVIVPAYSDGSVKVDDKDSLYIDFIVNPVSAVANLEKGNVTVLVTKVLTKAFPSVDSIKIDAGDLFEKDAAKGAVSVRVSVDGKLPAATDSTITVAVNVKNGVSNYTTDFASIYIKPLPAGALKGVFSVSATKKVRFSQGNLWADSNKALHFEANQSSFASSWDASHVSLFTWSSTVEAAVSNSNSGDNLFCDENHKVSVNGGEAIYYALSKDEWTYLFSNHSYKWATVNGVSVYVIAPDGFSGTLADSYADDAALAANNLVFLPAAGARLGSDVDGVGDYGYYWSSAAYDGSYAYDAFFSSSNVLPGNLDSRSYGISVRLVTEGGSPAPTPTTTGTAKRTGNVDVNWVQLWAGGPKFAEYNVGVTDGKAESYGGYYCWGKATDKDSQGAYNEGESALTGTDDTATNLWGENWRMPTKAELEALINPTNCNVAWTDNYNGTGIKGSIYTGKGAYASNSVFLPAAGCCFGGNAYDQGYYGGYWSSTPIGSDSAYDLYSCSDFQNVDGFYRNYGYSVRAVLAK